MGKKSSDTPPPPDPSATIRAQQEANQITQYTPSGNLVFGTVGPNGEFTPRNSGTATQIQETPIQAQLRKLGETGAINLANVLVPGTTSLPSVNPANLPGLTSELNFSGLPGLPSDVSATRDKAEKAYFERGLALLNPELAKRESQLRQRLSDQGIPVNSEAASGQFGDLARFERTRNEALSNLADQAVLQGGNEATRDITNALAVRGQGVGEQVQGANLAGSARQQLFGETEAQRAARLQELASFLGGQAFNPNPAAATGSFFTPGQVDVLGANQLALNQGNLQAGLNSQYNNALMGGLFDLAGAAGSAAIFKCSKAFKTNRRPVSEILPRIKALTVEAWDYRPGWEDEGTHIGPMAEDFKELFGVGDGRTIHAVDAFGVCLLGIQELTVRVEALEHGRHSAS